MKCILDIKKSYIILFDYYLYQPLDLERTFLFIYRTYPLSKKPKYVSLEELNYDYPEEKEINNFNIDSNIYEETINKIKLFIKKKYDIRNKSNSNIELKNYFGKFIGIVY